MGGKTPTNYSSWPTPRMNESTTAAIEAGNVQLFCFRLRNDLYCVEWGVKLYSLTHFSFFVQ